jgi:hypothetical protein
VRRRAVSVSCACALLLGAMTALGQGTPLQARSDAEAALIFGDTSEAGPPPDPVLAAVGDIACAPAQSAKPCKQLASADLASRQHPAAVAVLGDSQYENAALIEYYGPGTYNETWGRFNPIVRPAPGNHEYAASASATGYFTYFGSAAHGGYYSWNLGAWHLVALDSDCSDSGCGDSLAGAASSAQVSWLQGDLAANPARCVLAYWHHPRFSSGWVGNSPGVAPFWNVLYAAHADVVLAGHDHLYERFAQQDPLQHAADDGIREFVVGTGGESLFPMGAIQPNMQAVDNYDWAFRSIDGRLLDAGSAPCHPRATTQAGGDGAGAPASSEEQLAAVRSAALLHSGSAGDAARWRFGAWAQPLGRRGARRRTLQVRVHCSRACDLRIGLRARRGRRTVTLARYRETETEVSAPWSRIVLRLPRAARALPAAALKLAFVAVDASGQTRSLSLSLHEGHR